MGYQAIAPTSSPESKPHRIVCGKGFTSRGEILVKDLTQLNYNYQRFKTKTLMLGS
jgi:hypothetical protein